MYAVYIGFYITRKPKSYLLPNSLDKKVENFRLQFFAFSFSLQYYFLDLKCSTRKYLLPKKEIINF